jgi:pyrimidine-nucleoside phosphorylase
MNQVNLIEKKRAGEALSAEEIEFLMRGYLKDDIPDYQMSALLMAVYFQGMTDDETATWTRLMRDSGAVLDFSAIPGFKADKHSTGGVGDKISLILAPLVASAGLLVPMISGRGLGHTGGTLDKLEAIPGFRTNLTDDQIYLQMKKLGVVLVGQTENLCPADKRLYALRDATATVNSIPLITASILSKKLAEGLDSLVLDVKAGNGAIFADKEKAWELAKKLCRTAGKFGLKTSAVVTNMERPLGLAIGNWLETKEAILTLMGDGPQDVIELSLTLGAKMLQHADLADTLDEGKAILQRKLENGDALLKFREIVAEQGGDVHMVDSPEKYQPANFSIDIKAVKAGYVSRIKTRQLGTVAMRLGAGRKAIHEQIDYTAGILLKKRVGAQVKPNEVLATAFAGSASLLADERGTLDTLFEVGDESPEPEPLILGFIEADS